MSYLSGRHHIGRRGVEEIVETVFEVPTSLGSISALEAEMTAALTDPYQEAQAAVHDAPVKNTDETGWSEKGQKRWLWAAATATVAFFVIHLRRNFQGLQALLGDTITGVVLQRPLDGLQQTPPGTAPNLLGAPETRLSEADRSRRTC